MQALGKWVRFKLECGKSYKNLAIWYTYCTNVPRQGTLSDDIVCQENNSIPIKEYNTCKSPPGWGRGSAALDSGTHDS